MCPDKTDSKKEYIPPQLNSQKLDEQNWLAKSTKEKGVSGEK